VDAAACSACLRAPTALTQLITDTRGPASPRQAWRHHSAATRQDRPHRPYGVGQPHGALLASRANGVSFTIGAVPSDRRSLAAPGLHASAPTDAQSLTNSTTTSLRAAMWRPAHEDFRMNQRLETRAMLRPLAVSISMILAAAAARAQDSAPTAPPADTQGMFVLQEVVVTAQRREERLQDVPVAVTAIDEQQLI